MKNYYEILEISQTSSQQEIERAHKKLSAKYHPDNNGGVSFFNTVYNQIQEAYNVLSEESRKAEYDRSNNIINTDRSVSQSIIISESPPKTDLSSKSKKQNLDFSK